MAKQEPRPAYHRRVDVERLRELARPHPELAVSDVNGAYEVRLAGSDTWPLKRGRFEVIAAYLTGWAHARGLTTPVDDLLRALAGQVKEGK